MALRRPPRCDVEIPNGGVRHPTGEIRVPDGHARGVHRVRLGMHGHWRGCRGDVAGAASQRPPGRNAPFVPDCPDDLPDGIDAEGVTDVLSRDRSEVRHAVGGVPSECMRRSV